MFEIKTLLVLIPALPLAATLLTAVLGARVLRQKSHWPTVVAIALSFVASVILVFQVQREAGRPAEGSERIGYEKIVPLWTWAAVGDAYDQAATPAGESPDPVSRDFHIDVTLRADPLTAVMLATVTLISLLVAVYSIGYMHADPGYWRFFTYISLFVFSMTMLVSVSNFILLYIFWEAVGLCSYLLIGFWFQRPAAAAAGKKAFLVNRVGDFGFALGVFLIWCTFGTLDFHDVKIVEETKLVDGKQLICTNVVPDSEVGDDTRVVDEQAGVLGQTMLKHADSYQKFYQRVSKNWQLVATGICLLLILGACGKSAQFPLHVWLPDAMEGPTPVSALIHAATMVTAGVYMVARCVPLFVASDYGLEVVAVIGGFTALLAAAIALTQTDLKRILAYSTISQLGYMFLGLGAATMSVLGVTAGMFHLFTHAFFKALLFLGAGSVMHAMGGVIDIRQLGGLRRRLPTTHWTFLFGCLALAGFVPFAGFWSKDLILGVVYEQPGTLYRVLYVAAVFTAFLTALYTFRAFFITFYGEERIPAEAGDHPHESPPSMTVPLIILAVCSLLVGGLFCLTAYFWPAYSFAGFLEKTPSLAHPGLQEYQPEFHWNVAATSTAIVLAGIGLAWLLYAGRQTLVERLTRAMDFVRLYRFSHGKFFFDEIYSVLVVRPLEGIARLSYWGDRYLIDGLVNVCGLLPKLIGATLRPLQNGMVQFYALAMVLGLLVLIGALLM